MFFCCIAPLCKFVSLSLAIELNQILIKCDPFSSVCPPLTKSRLVLSNSCFTRHKNYFGKPLFPFFLI